ncbi:MAG: alpha-amylase family glycosyl hydrolase [bacterium]
MTIIQSRNLCVQKISNKQVKESKKEAKVQNVASQTLSLNNLAKTNSENLKAYFLNNKTAVKNARMDVAFGKKLDSLHELGANYDAKTDKYKFGLRSANAEKVRLCVFDGELGKEVMHIDCDKKDENGVFKFETPLSELKEKNAVFGDNKAIYYGYRVWGPNWKFDENWKPGSEDGFVDDVDDKGNRFNPNKLLLDPYAKEVSHDPISPEKVHVKDPAFYYATGPDHRLNDSAPIAPKSIAFIMPKLSDMLEELSPEEKKKVEETRTRPQEKEIVYETHLRGLTMRDEALPENITIDGQKAQFRGTYAAAGEKAKELADLGITEIEFLPVQETQNDGNDKHIESNYWGYMTNAFFAPERRFAADKKPGGPTQEYMKMAIEFNKNGIKVLNDVVYNHTGEGGLWANNPTTANLLSLRGIDNSSYYETADNGKRYYDNTGCGENINAANEMVRDLAVDSLKHWQDLGANGFRFDLAPVLANKHSKDRYEYDRDDSKNILNRLKKEIGRPEKGGKGVDLIAEPWAIGDNSYQVGNFPKGWGEWNDKFRDTMRKVENRCDDVTPGQMAQVISGSDNLFNKRGRTPNASVNFINAHDGFTLKDLHSYNNKNNIGSDGGTDDNISWDHFGSPAIQRQAVRNSFVDLLTSAGIPMFVGGDESLRTQNGNNNAYNLDNATTWMYWGWKTPKNLQETLVQGHREFTKDLIQFRKDHPSLAPTAFYTGKDGNKNGLADISWYDASGKTPKADYWDNPKNHFLAFRTDCTEAKFGKPESVEAQDDKSVYIAINKSPEGTRAHIPEPVEGKNWYVSCDTQESLEGSNIKKAGQETLLKRNEDGEYVYDMKGRTRLVLVEK